MGDEEDFDILYAKNKYSKPVKYAGWDADREAEPKDNDPYISPGGNYFKSTYDRLGFSPDPTSASETHDMLQQVYTKAHTAISCERKAGKNTLMHGVLSMCLCKENCESDCIQVTCDSPKYKTTMQHDYQPFRRLQQVTQSAPVKPWMVHRKCLSELTDSMRRDGVHKFQDDDLDKFYANRRALKANWYRSYDPATGKYTKYVDII